MKIITTYQANDGNIFNSEEECLRYEQTILENKYSNEISFYSFNREPMSLTAANNNPHEVAYIVVYNSRVTELLDIWKEENPNFDFDWPNFEDYDNACGLYYWDEYNDTWHYWQEEVDKLNELGEYFQQFPNTEEGE